MIAENGLVFAYLLNNGHGEALNWEQIKQWTPGQGLLWMHLDYKEEACKTWLREESGLSEIFCEALLAEETRPRVASESHAVLLILRGVNCNPGADPEDMISIRMEVDEHRVISMRHRRVVAVEDVRQCIAQAAKNGKVAGSIVQDFDDMGVLKQLLQRAHVAKIGSINQPHFGV